MQAFLAQKGLRIDVHHGRNLLHPVALGGENVTYLKDNKYKVDNINYKNIQKELKEFSETTFGENLVLDYSNYNVFFDKAKVKAKGLNLQDVKQSFKDYLHKQDYIKRVYTEEEITNGNPSDYYLDFITKGYDPTQHGETYQVQTRAVS